LQFKTDDIEVRLDPQCYSWFSGLPQGKSRKKIEAMLDTLKERPDAGDHVPRHLWPKSAQYQGINNLFRYEIDRGMRASYTIRKDELKRVVVVIEIFPDHKTYERRFNY